MSGPPEFRKVRWLTIADVARLEGISEQAVLDACLPDNATGTYFKSKLQLAAGTPNFERVIDASTMSMEAQKVLARMTDGAPSR